METNSKPTVTSVSDRINESSSQPYTGMEDQKCIMERWNFAAAVIHGSHPEKNKCSVVYEFEGADLENVINRIGGIYNAAGIEPKEIVLGNGLRIPYNSCVAHHFTAHGDLSLIEFLTISL